MEDYVAICVSKVIFARIGCALEFRFCRYFGSRSAVDVAWVRLGVNTLQFLAAVGVAWVRLGFRFFTVFSAYGVNTLQFSQLTELKLYSSSQSTELKLYYLS